MSIRYGVELLFDPGFTSDVYHLRQFVCGQFGCWAAEMHMLRMQLVPYFECPEASLDVLDAEIARVAAKLQVPLSAASFTRAGISSDRATGSVIMEITDPGDRLSGLHLEAVAAVQCTPGANVPEHSFRPSIALLEYGGLPSAILEDAAHYAASAAHGIADASLAWRLMVLRYSSEAAGDDWSNGRWANDVSWKQLFTYPLSA